MQKKPQALAPPEGSKASVYTETQHIPNVVREPAISPHTHTARHVVTSVTQPHILVRKKSPNLKVVAGTIASVIVIGLVTWVFLVQSDRRRQAALYQEMVSYAAKSGAAALPVTSEKLEILLKSVIAPNQSAARSSVFNALAIATAADTTDVDQRIAVFATTGEMSPEVREGLFREVLLKRTQSTAVPYLLDFLNAKTQEPSLVAAALQLIRSLSGVEQIDPLLNALVSTGNDEVRKAITETLDATIKNAPNRAVLAARIATLNAESTHDATRFALIRLLGRCGGSTAEEIVKSLLNSPDPINQNAALIALGSWSDASVIDLLTEFISQQTDQLNLRNRAFDSAILLLVSTAASDEASSLSGHWENLSEVAKTNDEQSKIIRGLAKNSEDWAGEIVLGYKNSDDASIADLATSVLEEINDLRRIKGRSPIEESDTSADSPSDSASTTEISTPSDEDPSAASDEIVIPSMMIQAEKYTSTVGVETEASQDVGGGKQLSNISPGDSTSYKIQVPNAGTYNAAFRICTMHGGTIRMYTNGSQTSCGDVDIPDNTVDGDWLIYETKVNLPAGICTLRLKYEGNDAPLFNINWFALYQGESIQSPTSFVTLETTSQAASENIIAKAEIPDGEKIQAEKYTASSGITIENCMDVGGGKQVAFIQDGDTTTHKIQVPKAGVYSMSFRVEPLYGGKISLYANNSKTSCGSLIIPNQTSVYSQWVTIETKANLPAGQVSLRLGYEGESDKYICNLNYFTISDATTSKAED